MIKIVNSETSFLPVSLKRRTLPRLFVVDQRLTGIRKLDSVVF